jgi:beta-lactamase class A
MLEKKDFAARKTKQLELKQKALEEKKQKQLRQKAVLIIFFLTTLLSAFLYFKPQFKTWKDKLFKPATYHIVNDKKAGKELESDLGFKPVLDNITELEKSLNFLIADLSGTYGVYFVLLNNAESAGINENQVYTAASVNKLLIMVNFYQQVEAGRLSEDEVYILKRADVQDYGTGILRYQSLGSEYTYKELVELSGKKSDNTAAWVLQNKVGSKTLQNSLDSLGMDKTSMKNNTTTPKQMGDYLVLLYNFKLLSEENTAKIFSFLTKTDFENRIPQGIPANIKVAHKIGNEAQTYNDCGIVFSNNPYVLCILTKEVKEQEALDVLPKISRLVFEFADKNKN